MTRATSPLLTLIVLVCGLAALTSTRGIAPAVAAVGAPGAALQAAAPVKQLDEPALVRTGTNSDGWAVYRLGAGRVPDRIPVGNGFRGETTPAAVALAGTRYSNSLLSPLPPPRRAPQLWARTGAGVRSVVLPTFAHGWPTRHHGGYDATGEGWRFLKAHPKP